MSDEVDASSTGVIASQSVEELPQGTACFTRVAHLPVMTAAWAIACDPNYSRAPGTGRDPVGFVAQRLTSFHCAVAGSDNGKCYVTDKDSQVLFPDSFSDQHRRA